MNQVRRGGSGSLFREVWRIERQIRDSRSPYHRVGHDGWPKQELVKFRTSQHMGFAGQDLVSAEIRRIPGGPRVADLAVDCMGLTGARGALPAHYTEMVLTQLKSHAPALRDFLDLFNHRLLSLFYRSWEKTQPAVHQERAETDVFRSILRALTGSGDDWEIFYGAALSRGARSAATIRSVLTDLTGMPVEVRPFQGGWASLADEDQTRLPGRFDPRGQHAQLGAAMLGSRAWVADRGARIVFYPGSREQLRALLPKGRFSGAIAQLIQRLIGGQVRVHCRIAARAGDLMDVRLGQAGRLGSDSFIRTRRPTGQKVEVSFKPSQGKG